MITEKHVIQSIIYNWFPPVEGGYVPESTAAFVGQDGVIAISEHPPKGEGDRWFYDIEYECGNVTRVFNPNTVHFKTNPS